MPQGRDRARASCSPPMSRPSSARPSSTTTTCSSTGPAMMEDGAIAADIGGRFDHVLVDEYQDTNRLQASILLAPEAGRARAHRGRRRRPVDLFLPRRARCATSSTFPPRSRPPAEVVTLEQNYRSTQPILAAANAVIGLAAERFTKNLWSDRLSSDRPRAGHRARRDRPGALRRRAHPREPRGRDAR